MNIELEVLSGPVAVLRLDGELSGSAVYKLEKAFCDSFLRGHVQIVVDMTGITFFNSSAAGALLQALTSAQSRSGCVILMNPSKPARESMSLLGLNRIFKYVKDVKEAKHLFDTKSGSQIQLQIAEEDLQAN